MSSELKEDEQWDKLKQLLEGCGLQVFINDVYVNFYSRLKKELLNSKSNKILIGYYFNGAESERLFINYDQEVALLNSESLTKTNIFKVVSYLRHVLFFPVKTFIDLRILFQIKYNKPNAQFKNRVVFIRTEAEYLFFIECKMLFEHCTPVFIPVRLSSDRILKSNSIKLSARKYIGRLFQNIFSAKDLRESVEINANIIGLDYLVSELRHKKIMNDLYHESLIELLKGRSIKHIYTFAVCNDEAVMDANIASIMHCKLTHVWRVDMALKQIPNVIPGSRAILMNKYACEVSKSFWPDNGRFFHFHNSFAFRRKELTSKLGNKKAVLICTGALYLEENMEFLFNILSTLEGKVDFYLRCHPRLPIRHNLPELRKYDESISYDAVFSWPSSIINEFIDNEIEIYVYRPFLPPYDYQESYYYLVDHITTVRTLESLSEEIQTSALYG